MMRRIKKVLIIALAAVAIAYMMPSVGMVSLQPTQGQEWRDATLVATFDVPIKKSQEAIDDERREVLNNAKPVFSRDTAIIASKVQSLLSHNTIDSLSRASLAHSLSDIYRRGIVSQSELSNYLSKAVFVKNSGSNSLQTLYMNSFYTPQSAVEKLKGSHTALNEELLIPLLVVNTTYNKTLSGKIREELLEDVSTTRGVVRSGEVIVSRGQTVDSETLMAIRSYNDAMAQRLSLGNSFFLMLLMRFLIVFSVLLLNYLFFTRFAVHYMETENRKLIFVLLLYFIVAGAVGAVIAFGGNPYLIPLPIVAVYMLTFFNMRVAILGNLTAVLICSLFVSSPFDYFTINVLSGLLVIFMMRHFYHRGKLLRAIGAMLLSEVVLYSALVFLHEDSFVSVDYYNLLWIAASTLLLMGLYQFIYLLERLFGFVSDVTLLELCDTNQPLLMQLAQNAPGTFQHSVQVANLAESAAKEIGANPLLARTDALYHDIGKMNSPFYFVENLSGVFNPHNDCTPQRSTEIIKSHVSEGVAIARKHNLPKLVQYFIEGHHGDSLIFYFFDKARKEGEVEEADFRYSGPKPVLREVSICMMADAIEAASRSLPSYEAEELDTLVNNIINSQIKDGQFENSQLTFQEVGKIKALFKAKLNNIYHGRIAYPKR